MAALLMYRNQELPHGVKSWASCDIDVLICTNTFPDKDFGKSIIEKPSLQILRFIISIGFRENLIYYGKEFTELKKAHDFFLPLYPVVV